MPEEGCFVLAAVEGEEVVDDDDDDEDDGDELAAFPAPPRNSHLSDKT